MAASRLPEQLKDGVRELLVGLGDDASARPVLDHGVIQGFTAIDDAAYDDIPLRTHQPESPPNKPHRLRRGQVANHLWAEQPPPFEAARKSNPPDPRRPQPEGDAARRATMIWPTSMRSQSMPDPGDTNVDNVFSTPGEQPDPAPSGHDNSAKEVKLKDVRGSVRLPAYVLIALVIALASILLLVAGLLLAPR